MSHSASVVSAAAAVCLAFLSVCSRHSLVPRDPTHISDFIQSNPTHYQHYLTLSARVNAPQQPPRPSSSHPPAVLQMVKLSLGFAVGLRRRRRVSWGWERFARAGAQRRAGGRVARRRRRSLLCRSSCPWFVGSVLSWLGLGSEVCSEAAYCYLGVEKWCHTG